MLEIWKVVLSKKMPVRQLLNNHGVGKKVTKTENWNGNYSKYCLCKNFKPLGGRNCPKESQMKQQNVQRQIKPLYEKVNSICNMC